MVAPDLSVFQNQRTLLDQQQLQEAFEQRKQQQALQAVLPFLQLQQAQSAAQYNQSKDQRDYALRLADFQRKSSEDSIVPMGQAQPNQTGFGAPLPHDMTSSLTPLQHSQLMAESGGDPNAVSPAGAHGLMQLMGPTAANPGFGIAPVRDNSPAENLRVGTQYQSALTKKYGDPATALVAYNWGPGNTDKWLANGADPSQLPTETKNYVSKVFAGANEQPNTMTANMLSPPSDMGFADMSLDRKQGNTSPFASKKGRYLTEGLPQGYAMRMDGTAAPIPGTPQAQLGDNVSSNLHGEDYLGTLKPDVAAQVKALSEGRRAFPTGSAMKSPQVQQLIAAVSQYDPNFDAVNYNARSNTRNDFTSGKSAQNITSFNTALGHLSTLQDAADKLDNGAVPVWNAVANTFESGIGDPRINNFESAKGAVSDELEKAFRGSGGSVAGIEDIKKNINSSASPAQLSATIRQYTELLKSRIDAVGEQYNNGMGTTKDPLELLTPKAKEAYDKISGIHTAFDAKKAALQTDSTNNKASAISVKMGNFTTPSGTKYKVVK